MGSIAYLKSLTSKIGSGATPRGGDNVYIDHGVAFIRSQNVIDFYFLKEGLVYVDDECAKQLSNVEVFCDDILLNITGDSVARCCMVDKAILPARVNQHVAIIRVAKCNDTKYVFYYLQYLKDHLLSLSEIGATRRALTKGMLESLEIYVPNSLKEQQAIAAVLSSLDDKIDLLHRQNKTLEAMGQTLFRQWFVEEADSDVEASLSEFAENIRENVTADNLNMYNNYIGLEHIEKKQMSLYRCGNPEDIASNKSKFFAHDILFGKL